MISGGKDGKLILWDVSVSNWKKVDEIAVVPDSGITALDWSMEGKIVVGSEKSDIYLIDGFRLGTKIQKSIKVITEVNGTIPGNTSF